MHRSSCAASGACCRFEHWEAILREQKIVEERRRANLLSTSKEGLQAELAKVQEECKAKLYAADERCAAMQQKIALLTGEMQVSSSELAAKVTLAELMRDELDYWKGALSCAVCRTGRR